MALYLEGFLVACRGIPNTVWVSLVAVLIGTTAGMFLALMRISKRSPIKWIAKVYIDVIRGTPMIVQAFILAYAFPYFLQVNKIHFIWPNLVIPAVIVCGLNSAAYMAEIIRSGLQAVPKGQMEAAMSLGMTHKMAMKLIIIPQAIRVILPSIGNEFVTLIKETSILGFVGVVEIMRQGTFWNSITFEAGPAYIGVALAYMILTIPLSKLIIYLEHRMSSGVQK